MDKLPFIRSVSLKHNGISDEHEREILQLMGISKIKSLDLSFNKMYKLGDKIGKKLRDEVTHFEWLDLTQNEFSIYVKDVKEKAHGFNIAILNGLKK